jgi:hypothetical protein
MLWLIAVSMLVVLCENDEEDENIEQWRQDGGSRYSQKNEDCCGWKTVSWDRYLAL